MRKTITLLGGHVLTTGDCCRALVRGRWRAGTIVEIMQGSGVERAWVLFRDGKRKIVSRYSLQFAPLGENRMSMV